MANVGLLGQEAERSPRRGSFLDRTWPAILGKPKGASLWNTKADFFWVAGGGSLLFMAALIPLAFLAPNAAVTVVVLFGFLSWLCNTPHYAATYALIYRERESQPLAWQRLRASLPYAIGALFLCGFFFRYTAPFITRLYFTWSPYHYGAQNFGLAAMYAARSGSALDAGERRKMQLSFGATSLFAMLLANSDVTQYMRRIMDPSVYQTSGLLGRVAFVRLPAVTYYFALPLFAAAAIQFMSIVVRRARSGNPLPGTTVLLFWVNAAWFVLPRLRLHAGDHEWLGPVLGTMIPVAVPFFHCAQYLGVVGWRARLTGAVRPLAFYAALVVMGWFLFQGTMYVIEGALTRTVLQATAVVIGLVNIHHFYIDGLIWKRGRMPQPAKPETAPAAEVAPLALERVA